jgi:two-component system, response regulator PdtaR
MQTIQILIIEDEALIAEDISDIVRSLGYEVAASIGNGDRALDYLMSHHPDLVICDIMIKGTRDGIYIADWLRKNRKIPFIYLTSLADRDTLDKAKATLPYGYIVKPFDEKDLLTTIELAWYKFNQEIESAKLTREKLDLLAIEPLTNQEYTILSEMIQGKINEQICAKLFISNNTLKYHTKNILYKFNSSNRGEIMQKILTKWMNPS